MYYGQYLHHKDATSSRALMHLNREETDRCTLTTTYLNSMLSKYDLHFIEVFSSCSFYYNTIVSPLSA